MNDYPTMIATVGHVEPVPRRIRAYLAAEKVLDTTQALYVWEWPNYPQYYIPLTDVRRDLLPRLHRFKDMGWVAAFADDGTVTHESIRVTWHGP